MTRTMQGQSRSDVLVFGIHMGGGLAYGYHTLGKSGKLLLVVSAPLSWLCKWGSVSNPK